MDEYEWQPWDVIPSRVYHPKFIGIRSRESFNMRERHFYVRLYTKGGYWILLFNNRLYMEEDLTEHDIAWGKIRELIREGVVIQACCSTLARNEIFPDVGSIFCYTEDYTNKQNVREVAEQIRRVTGYQHTMWYRLTERRVIGEEPPTDFELYYHMPDNELYECDVSTNPWSWVLVPPTGMEN